jgi:hypothetical protein
MFHLVPEVDNKLHTTEHRYRLSDPELIAKILPSHDAGVDRGVIAGRLNGLVEAAMSMNIDILVVSPPESYRGLLELKLTKAGLVVAYEDYAILSDGSLYKVGYRLAATVPAAPHTTNAHVCYDRWVATQLDSVKESELWKVVDPWTTYLQHELRTHYQSERETSH